MIDVTYGILNFNPSNHTEAQNCFERCVDSLANNKSRQLKSEVFIIDQGGPEQQRTLAESLARKHGFNAITLDKNIGISRGINFISSIARGKYISLITSDTIFTPNLDHILIEDLEQNPDIWQICPLSNRSEIPYQKVEDFQVNADQSINTGRTGVVRCIAEELTIQFWSREFFNKIGYFDEKFKAAYENMDAALRCFLADGFAAISNRAFCYHELNMCVKSGARDHSYDGYIHMPNGFNQALLAKIWREKWRYIDWNFLYDPNLLNDAVKDNWKHFHSTNIYLPYIQEIGY